MPELGLAMQAENPTRTANMKMEIFFFKCHLLLDVTDSGNRLYFVYLNWNSASVKGYNAHELEKCCFDAKPARGRMYGFVLVNRACCKIPRLRTF